VKSAVQGPRESAGRIGRIGLKSLLVVLVLALPLSAQAPGVWTLSGNLNTARGSHAAAMLPNGKALIAGGVCGELLISPESAIRHTHAGDALLRLANAGNFEANSSGDLCANIYVYDDVQEQVTDKNGA